jgi:hypothetical protein
VAACREILDRAYGKVMQPIQGTVDYGISEQLAELFRGNEGNTLGQEIARRALPAPNGQQPLGHGQGASCNALLDGQRVREAQPATKGPVVAATARRLVGPGQRLAVRIAAPADAIHPLRDP